MGNKSKKKTSKKRGGEPDPNLVVIARMKAIDQVFSTIRTVVIACGVLGGLYIVQSTVELVIDSPKWFWLLVAILSGSGPMLVTGVAVSSFKSKIGHWARRMARLESHVDPGRTTSGLLEDGTHEDDT